MNISIADLRFAIYSRKNIVYSLLKISNFCLFSFGVVKPNRWLCCHVLMAVVTDRRPVGISVTREDDR